jgi:hypothetical protein
MEQIFLFIYWGDLFGFFFREQGWQGSNLRMLESKSSALPLGDTPTFLVRLFPETLEIVTC